MSQVIKIPNWINNSETYPEKDAWIEKYDPHRGILQSLVADSSEADVDRALNAASKAFPSWSSTTPVKRGQILSEMVSIMKMRFKELAECVAIETGKPPQDAKSETNAAILQGEYWASEGMRLYGRTLTSGMQNRYSFTVRQPRGIATLIVPANTPIANITWKIFPAMLCGNTFVLKASEDAPMTAILLAKIAKEAGIPEGVFNIIQGRGEPAGAALVRDSRVNVISFTGSTIVGKWIAETAGKRLARVSLELGGKNPFVVCDDADMENAVKWAALSAFSNAGQRCAAGSRIIIFESIYEEFKTRLKKKAQSLKLGIAEGCDIGPVINKRQHENILQSIKKATDEGASLLCGGFVPRTEELKGGYYIAPTLIENARPSSEICCKEIFGPVATLHCVKNIQEALELANSTDYGLTACIHTKDIDRAIWFVNRVKAGVANINIGTYGSEPHMPFGGWGASGNGTREPGIEALDVYTELKNISVLVRPELI